MSNPKTVDVLVRIPAKDIVEVCGPELLRAAKAAELNTPNKIRVKAPYVAVLAGVSEILTAADDYDNSQFTTDERRALRRLLTAAKGLKKAYLTYLSSEG